MPVIRYQTLEEAERAGWLEPGDPTLAQRWEALWRLSQLAPAAPSLRGVLKFASIEQANRQREDWVQCCVEAGKARIVEGPGQAH